MTTKRFIIDEYFEIGSVVIDTENENVRFKHENKLSMKQCCDLLNELHEENIELHIQNDFLKDENQHMRDLVNENEQLRTKNNAYIQDIEVFKEENTHLKLKNEELKEDNNALIHLLENQSMIIQELHSKLLEYQVKEPIVLTKEDLELMDKAISYYTHGRCGE